MWRETMCGRSFTFAVCFLALVGPSCTNSDNLALLLNTLRPEHRAVCDGETVSLACPTGTAVSILVAQYGDNPPKDHECEAEVDRTCKLPNKLQYMLLQRVVEACQKKPHCIFSTNPGPEDPCPSSRKFVEVSYKCRPFEFRSLNACDEQTVSMSCNPYSRIAIYDVQYGRNKYESTTCPQPKGITDETCSSPLAAEVVRRICHGRRRCRFEANRNTFQTTCQPFSRPYVKVIYACVPLGVLTERYESQLEKDEGDSISSINEDNRYDESGGAGVKWREPILVPSIADPALQPPTESGVTPQSKPKDTTYKPTNKDVDKANNPNIIYIGASLIIFILIITIIVGIRCYCNRKAKEIAKNGEMFSTETPNVFNDAASDMDNDVEVSHISGTFYDPVHPDMILYRDVDGRSNTLRAMRPLSTIYPCAGPRMYGNVDYVPPQPRQFGGFGRSRSKEEEEPEHMTSPKSLGAYSTSQFYYG